MTSGAFSSVIYDAFCYLAQQEPIAMVLSVPMTRYLTYKLQGAAAYIEKNPIILNLGIQDKKAHVLSFYS